MAAMDPGTTPPLLNTPSRSPKKAKKQPTFKELIDTKRQERGQKRPNWAAARIPSSQNEAKRQLTSLISRLIENTMKT